MLAKRENVVKKLQELDEAIDPIVTLFEDPEVAEHMKRYLIILHGRYWLLIASHREDQNLFDYLAQNHNVRL